MRLLAAGCGRAALAGLLVGRASAGLLILVAVYVVPAVTVVVTGVGVGHVGTVRRRGGRVAGCVRRSAVVV